MRDPLILKTDPVGLLLDNKVTKETVFVCELQPRVREDPGWKFHLTRGDLSDVAKCSHLRLFWTKDALHVAKPSGKLAISANRLPRKAKTYGTHGENPRHEFSRNGRDYLLSGEYRLFGKYRFLQDVSTQNVLIRFKTSGFSMKNAGVLEISDELQGEDLDIMLGIYLAFHLRDDVRDNANAKFIG